MERDGVVNPDLMLLTIVAEQADAFRRAAASFTQREQAAAQVLRQHFFAKARPTIILRLRANLVNTLFARTLLPDAKWEQIYELGAPVARVEVVEGIFFAFASGDACGLPEHHHDGYWFILRDSKYDYCVPAEHWAPVVLRFGMTETRRGQEPPFGAIDYVLPVQSWLSYVEARRTRSHADV